MMETYSIDKPFGEEGYSISFTVPEGSTEITPVGTASNGYYAFYVSSPYYVSLYTAGGYSEFDEHRKRVMSGSDLLPERIMMATR